MTVKSSPLSALPPPFNQPLPGLNPILGLQTWGNSEEYLKSLLGFARKHGKDSVRLKEALSVGDFQSAKHISHTLKGLAGTLFAADLARASTELDAALSLWGGQSGEERACERLLKQKNSDLSVLVEQVEWALNTVIQSCQPLFPQEKKKKPPSLSAPMISVDPIHRASLQELIAVLRSGNAVRASELLAALEKPALLSSEIYNHILEQIEDFEFLAAEKLVENILISIGNSSDSPSV